MVTVPRNMLATSLRTLVSGVAVAIALANGSVSIAQGNGMVIRHDVSFAVSRTGLDIEESKDGTKVFITRAVRQVPFLELQFSPPIPQRLTRGKTLKVFCDEAGTYAPPSGGSWTIAKRCRMKN